MFPYILVTAYLDTFEMTLCDNKKNSYHTLILQTYHIAEGKIYNYKLY